MILLDANVLIYAFCRDAARHAEYKAWVEAAVSDEEVFGVSEFVLSAVVRILTHPKILARPASAGEALDLCDLMLAQPNAVCVRPGNRHWSIFSSLCRRVEAKGNLVPDAFLAALAMESGAELITTDRDFARFPGLQWRHPLG